VCDANLVPSGLIKNFLGVFALNYKSVELQKRKHSEPTK